MIESNNPNVFVRVLQEKSHINLPKSVVEKLKFDKFVKIIVNKEDITIKPLELS